MERSKGMSSDELKTYNQQLLQGLLSDRFKLKLRMEMKDMPTYSLGVAKNGSRLKPAHGVAGNPKTTWRPGLITGQGASVDDLAKGLQEAVHHPVENLTALNGAYDFRLEWSPDQGTIAADPLDPAAQQNDSADYGPTLFAALQEQLGLRLDRRNTRAPYEAIVSVELPADN